MIGQHPGHSLVILQVVIFRAVSDLVLCRPLDTSRQHVDLLFLAHRLPLVQNVGVLDMLPSHFKADGENRAQAVRLLVGVVNLPSLAHNVVKVVFHGKSSFQIIRRFAPLFVLSFGFPRPPQGFRLVPVKLSSGGHQLK